MPGAQGRALLCGSLCLTLRMLRSLKSGNVVVMLQGRHAGKKAVIVRQVRVRRFRGTAGGSAWRRSQRVARRRARERREIAARAGACCRRPPVARPAAASISL